MIAFTKVRLPYGWLGNMSPYEVGTPKHGVFRTAEAAFQASRFLPGSPAAELIQRQASPMAAKMVAKPFLATEAIVTPRSPEDVLLMEDIVWRKILRHDEISKLLLATGEEVIVEDVTNRPSESGLFWGAVVVDGEQTRGANHLGAIWMKLRDRLRE